MTLRYMLDTDSVSYALRGHGSVADRILEAPVGSICMSSVTLGELRYGAELRGSKKLHALIDDFVAAIDVLAYDQAAGDRYGRLAAMLTRAGSPIGAFDTQIAAHALAAQVTLVTNNTKHFSRVRGLRTENWY